MIQRIQSLYLLIVAGLMTTSLFLPLAHYVSGLSEYELFAFSLKGADYAQPTPYLGFMLLLTAIVPLVTIFLYKKRLLQIRLCAVNIVLLLGTLIFIAIYYYLGSRFFAEFSYEVRGFDIAAIFPLLSLVLTYLAARAIFKDEMLVRSLDRIR